MPRPVLALSLLLIGLAGPIVAQPLEQNFAFGAPSDVLGNNRVRVPPRVTEGRPFRRGRVGVRLERRGYAHRRVRSWRQ